MLGAHCVVLPSISIAAECVLDGPLLRFSAMEARLRDVCGEFVAPAYRSKTSHWQPLILVRFHCVANVVFVKLDSRIIVFKSTSWCVLLHNMQCISNAIMHS